MKNQLMKIDAKQTIDNYLFDNAPFSQRIEFYAEKLQKRSKENILIYNYVIDVISKEEKKLNDIDNYLSADMFLYYYYYYNKEFLDFFFIEMNKINKALVKNKVNAIENIKHFCNAIKVKCFNEKDFLEIYKRLKKLFSYNRTFDYITAIDISVCGYLEKYCENKKSIFDIFDIPFIKVNKTSDLKRAIKKVLLSLNIKNSLQVNFFQECIENYYSCNLDKNKNLQYYFNNTLKDMLLEFYDTEIDIYLNLIYPEKPPKHKAVVIRKH